MAGTWTAHHGQQKAGHGDVHDASLRRHVQGSEGVHFSLVARFQPRRHRRNAPYCQHHGNEFRNVVDHIAVEYTTEHAWKGKALWTDTYAINYSATTMGYYAKRHALRFRMTWTGYATAPCAVKLRRGAIMIVPEHDFGASKRLATWFLLIYDISTFYRSSTGYTTCPARQPVKL